MRLELLLYLKLTARTDSIQYVNRLAQQTFFGGLLRSQL